LSFSAPIEQFVVGNPRNVVTADFDRDSRADLAIANGDMGFVSIVLGRSLFVAPRYVSRAYATPGLASKRS